MDVCIATMGAELPKEPLNHEGQQSAFALEGRIEFINDGQSTIVEPGEGLYFDSDRPHSSRSLDGGKARILVVFNNPFRPD